MIIFAQIPLQSLQLHIHQMHVFMEKCTSDIDILILSDILGDRFPLLEQHYMAKIMWTLDHNTHVYSILSWSQVVRLHNYMFDNAILYYFYIITCINLHRKCIYQTLILRLYSSAALRQHVASILSLLHFLFLFLYVILNIFVWR